MYILVLYWYFVKDTKTNADETWNVARIFDSNSNSADIFIRIGIDSMNSVSLHVTHIYLRIITIYSYNCNAKFVEQVRFHDLEIITINDYDYFSKNPVEFISNINELILPPRVLKQMLTLWRSNWQIICIRPIVLRFINFQENHSYQTYQKVQEFSWCEI